MTRRQREYPPVPELAGPNQFRTARGTHDSVRSAVQPRHARSVPGSQERAASYASSVLQPARQRHDRHMGGKNRTGAVLLSSLALLALGAAADRVVQSSNRAADVAGELQQNPQAVAHDLLRNGSDGVVTVQLRNGANVDDEANRIATSSASGEVDLILGAQQQGDTVGDPGVAVVPAGDLKAAQLDAAQPVTPQTLIEFEGTRTVGQ